jgi:hypothetical protein
MATPTALTAPTAPTAVTVVNAPTATARAGSRRRLVRGALAVLAAVLALLGSWALLRTGVQVDAWPSFLPDADSTSITRYSGPWITAAAAAALVAGLLLLMGTTDLVRYRRSTRLSV